MTDWVAWFRYQLQASADGFVWAFSQISPQLQDSLPPAPDLLGDWSPVRHVWHVTEYERHLALPSMKQSLGGPMPNGEAWVAVDNAWDDVQNRGFDLLTSEFRDVRQQQIDLLDKLIDTDWDAPQGTVWGHKPLSMVVTKTFQHTYEHSDTLLKMGLWWEAAQEQVKRSENAGS
ncbi:MAG: DinB family protein [Anaerolineae bacterium]